MMIYQDMRQIRRDIARIDRARSRSRREELERELIRAGTILAKITGWIFFAVVVGYFIIRIFLSPARAEVYVPAPELPRGYAVEATVTAYTSSPDETDDTPFITASGATTRRGIVACPSKYPFGTRLEIEGKEYDCQDRMNRRYRDDERFDVWVPTKSEARKWGKKELEITVLYPQEIHDET